MLASARSSAEQRIAAGEIVLHLGVVQRVVQALGQPLAHDGVIGIGAGQRGNSSSNASRRARSPSVLASISALRKAVERRSPTLGSGNLRTSRAPSISVRPYV